jgi:Domain of unknown function (DUF1840)
MSYEFKSKAAGHLILLGTSGERLLRAIGKEPSATGIIAPAAMPKAIEAIQAAIVQEEMQAQRGPPPRGDGVTLRARAWPLVEMMKRAHHDDEAIVWGV